MPIRAITFVFDNDKSDYLVTMAAEFNNSANEVLDLVTKPFSTESGLSVSERDFKNLGGLSRAVRSVVYEEEK